MALPYSEPLGPPQQLILLPATPGTPEALGTVERRAHAITLMGYKATRTVNVGRVWVQFSTTTDGIGLPIDSGAALTIEMPTGKHISLSDVYINAVNAGDGVVVVYW